MCRKAAEDDLFFEVVRRHPAYGLVEALPVAAGQDYIEIALRQDPTLRDRLGALQQNDRYGGQCRILYALNAVDSYSLFDLDEALALARRYLGHFPIDGVAYRDIASAADEGCDLVISNYAFSELRKEVQDLYWERLIRARDTATCSTIRRPSRSPAPASPTRPRNSRAGCPAHRSCRRARRSARSTSPTRPC